LSVALTLWGAGGAAACLYATRRLRMPLRIAGARGFMARHWRTSMDYIVSFQAQWLGSQGVVYLATPVVGASGIGAFSSVANILAFTNAIGTTMDNALPLRFAEEYRRGGEPALRRYALRAGAAVTVLLVLILLPIGLFADRIVAVLLGGAYAPYSNILWAHCINVAFVFASKIALYHERARLNTRRIAQSTIIGSIASVLFVIHLTRVLGPVGLVWSAVLSSTVSLVFLAFCMYRDERLRG
jgi:O-antigen/teichoic acid export membrane protein